MSFRPAAHRDEGEAASGAQRDAALPRYEIRIRGHLGDTMRNAFPVLDAKAQGGDTVLRGTLEDQAALFGVLGEIEALGLELLEVRRLPPN